MVFGWDRPQEALSNGAIGYVWKQDAGLDLLPAVEAALRGADFVSRGIHADNSRNGVGISPDSK